MSDASRAVAEIVEMAILLTRDKVLADLREKVRALEHRGFVFEGADPPFDLISRTAVLALLDGGKE